jgi:hypothetical protein
MEGLEKEFEESWIDFLTNKYLWLVLLIYAAPTIVFLASMATTQQGYGLAEGTTEVMPSFGIFEIFIYLFIFAVFPILALYNLALGWPIIPYFILAYGLLYWYYRREQTKKQTKKTERTYEQGIKEGPGDHL